MRAKAGRRVPNGTADPAQRAPDGRRRCRVLRPDHRRGPLVLRRQLPFRYFRTGSETLRQALDAHTDLVAEMVRPTGRQHILDVGCGLGVPALRIAERYGCKITAVNISREQIRQGRQLIDQRRMSHRVSLVRGDARALDFPDGSFDAIVCLEAAGDICVSEPDKERLVHELHRVLRPGGRVGFSDLALHTNPSRTDDRTLRAGPLSPRRRARHRLAGALSPPGLHRRRLSRHHRRDDADLASHPGDLRAAFERSRPALRHADRQSRPRAGTANPVDPRPLRDLPGALRSEVIAVSSALGHRDEATWGLPTKGSFRKRC